MISDFIVIGSGLAGLTSSLILAKYGKVLLVTKGKLSDGATNWAQGGIACAVEAGDSWKKHMKDTLVTGSYHNDKKAVEFLVKNAPAAIDWLFKQGVPFEEAKGKYKTGREGGHSYNRILHATDFTGKEIENTLTAKVRKNKNIKIWENAFVKDLLVRKGKCYGVEIAPQKAHPSPEILTLRSSHPLHTTYCFATLIILATGGLGQIYECTTNPYVATGDGVAMAYRAGAKLKDMEFIQFHPTALKFGESPLFLLSEALRGEGAYLVKIRNPKSEIRKIKKGKRFMGDYDKRLELAPRDIVSRAIFDEQKKGYGIFLDIRHKGKEFLMRRFPNIYKELKKRGFDLARDLIPVTPAAHYSCGGVKTDLYGRTNIRNLFAFGEVAATGVHGANRLASNSLLESVVFPLRLKELIRQKSHSGLSRIIRDEWDSGVVPTYVGTPQNDDERIKKYLQQLMWGKAGIVRSFKELIEANKQIIKWEKELEGLEELEEKEANREFCEIQNMLLVARLITEAALKRKKSLGAHFVTKYRFGVTLSQDKLRGVRSH